MAIISSLATRTLVDVEIMKRRMAEVKEWQSAYSKAVRAKDQKNIDKLKKRQAAINKLQADMTKDNFKPMLVTLVPFWIFYYIFYGVFDYNKLMVAYSPLDLPVLGTTLTFWSFYFISSFGIYGLVQRLFNLPSAPD
jgi:uncharacterized membrane protein (DUF106 family)